MQYRMFGRTGLKVSEVVFGGGWVGGLLIHQDDATKLRTLQRALDAGINWIDTAASYGNGKSEQALGWLLRELDGKPYLSTKVVLNTEQLDDIGGQIERNVTASLRRLNRSSVDLILLHNFIEPTVSEGRVTPAHVLGAGGAAEALERLRSQGITRYIGMTALGNVESCKQVISSGRFDAAQVYYNMLNPSAARSMPPRWTGEDMNGLIAACKSQGTAVMAIRILAAGVLASEERHGREVVITRDADLTTEARRAKAVFGALGAQYGTRSQAALRYVLSNPDIACAIVGLAEPEHLEEALAGEAMGPLPQAALDRLEQVYASGFAG